MSAGYTAHAGLFEWSIQQQEGSTDPAARRHVTPEDRKWFMEAMGAHTQDVSKRLRDIKGALDDKDDSDAQVGEKLKLLDDLMEIVEQIDYARGESFLKLRPVFSKRMASIWGLLLCFPMGPKSRNGFKMNPRWGKAICIPVLGTR